MCTASYLQDVAVSMGMCPEKGLPMANEENKKILAMIDDLTGQKNQLQTTLQHFNERADRLVNHARNSEITHNQNMRLIFAFQSDLRTEQNLRKLAERENSKLKHDLKGIDQELEALNQHEDTTENDIKKRNKTIRDLSSRISWIKTALDEWRQCMAEGHEANLLIEKYCKEDHKKYIEIDNKRRILQNAINKERQKLIDLVEEQKSLEQNLDRTANLYRNAHAERRDMVNTWKSSVNHMNQRESDILQLEAEYEKLLKTCQVKEAELKNEEKNLDDILTNNREVEADIEELNEEISRLRERLQNVIDTVALRENEVDILKKELAGLAHRVELQRRNNRRDVQRQSDKELELTRCIEGNKKLDENHKTLTNKNMNAQERLRVIEEMIDSEERTKGKLTLETNRMNDLLFRTQEHLRRFKEDAKLAEVENGGIRLNMATMATQLKDANKTLITKTEELYDLSLKVVIVERRIGKVKGNLVDPYEERQRIVQLTKLEVYYEDLTKTLTGLQGQTMKLEADMRKLTLCYNNDMKEVESMNFKIKEVQLYCEGGVKKHRQTIRENQERIVELSILKMRHNEMEHQKAQCQDRTYNLDKHRLEMNKSIKQRTVNIQAQFDLLYLKRKHLLEELSTLRCDIGDRSIRIEAAKARYELAASLLGKNDDGSLVTCTQMKIENAQEKQMLLDEGNQLNADVLRAEQEIKAMEHTLVLMNSSNEMYRRNFEELDEDAEDLQQLKTLQTEYCTLLTQLKTLRNRIIQQERQVEMLLQEKEALEDSVQEILRKRLDNKEMLTKVHKELQDQEVKIQRADREAKVAWKSTRQRSFSTAFLANFNKELELQELEKRNNTVLQLFADLIDTDMDLAPQASKMLYSKGLECPKARKYRSYSSSWRGEFQDLSSSSKEMLSSRSSGSVTKMSASTRASIVTIDFPCEGFSVKRK